MLLVIRKLVWPELLVEVEIFAARRRESAPEAVTTESIAHLANAPRYIPICARGSRVSLKAMPRHTRDSRSGGAGDVSGIHCNLKGEGKRHFLS